MLSGAERIWATRVNPDWTVTVVGDDRELARAAAAGDREAFGRLVERYQRTIYLRCYRFVAITTRRAIFPRMPSYGPGAACADSKVSRRFRHGCIGSASTSA